jgi:hypothetical protein
MPPGGHNWVLFGLFMMGMLTLFFVGAWYNQWRRRLVEVPDSLESARHEFSNLMSERIGVAMRAGELDAVIVERWNDWPLEYRPALYMMLRQAQLLEETMYIEAVQEGIYPKRLFEGDILPPRPRPSQHDGTPERAPLTAPEPVSNVVPLKAHRAMFEWVNGQLLKLTG